MIFGLQIIGLFFGLFMLYLTFLYYKRKDYDIKSFIAWTIIWLFFLIMVIFPASLYGLMEIIDVQRTVDFFVIAGFLFFSLIIFYLFVTVKNIQKKVEKIVREFAIKRAK